MAEFKAGDWVRVKAPEKTDFEHILIQRGGAINSQNLYQIERVLRDCLMLRGCDWHFSMIRFSSTPLPKELNKPLSSYL